MPIAFLAAALLVSAIAGCGTGPGRARAENSPDSPALDEIGSSEAARFRGAEGRTQFEKACELMRGGRTAAAVAEFNKLIPKEPPAIGEDSLPDYDCLDHRACLAISECFEKSGDAARALEFAKMARDVYVFYSPAGSTVKAHEMMLAERIARLEAAASRRK